MNKTFVSLAVGLLLWVPTSRGDLFSDLGLQRPDPNMGRRPPVERVRSEAQGSGRSDPSGPSARDLKKAERDKRERAATLQREWTELGRNLPTVYAPAITVVTVPDTRMFSSPPAATDTFLAPLAKAVTPGTEIAPENLRRAAALAHQLTKSAQPISDEDAAFLASQAALAMEGAPLQVIVSETPAPRAVVKELKTAVTAMARDQVEVQQARTDRGALMSEYQEVTAKSSRGELDPVASAARQKELKERYAAAARREKVAKKALQQSTSGVVRVFVSGREQKP